MNKTSLLASILVAYLIVAWSSVGATISQNVVSYADDDYQAENQHEHETTPKSTELPDLWKFRLIDQLRSGQFLTETRQQTHSNYDVAAFNQGLQTHYNKNSQKPKMAADANVESTKMAKKTSSKMQMNGYKITTNLIGRMLTTTENVAETSTKYFNDKPNISNVTQQPPMPINVKLKLKNLDTKWTEKVNATNRVEKRRKFNKGRLKTTDNIQLQFYQKLLRSYNNLDRPLTMTTAKIPRKTFHHQINNQQRLTIPMGNRAINVSNHTSYAFSVPHFDSVTSSRHWSHNLHRPRPIVKSSSMGNTSPMIHGMFPPHQLFPTIFIRCSNGIVTTLLNRHQCNLRFR